MKMWVMKRPGYDLYDVFLGDSMEEEYVVITGWDDGFELQTKVYGPGAAVEPLFSVTGPMMKAFVDRDGMQELVDSLCDTFNIVPSSFEARLMQLEKAVYGGEA